MDELKKIMNEIENQFAALHNQLINMAQEQLQKHSARYPNHEYVFYCAMGDVSCDRKEPDKLYDEEIRIPIVNTFWSIADTYGFGRLPVVRITAKGGKIITDFDW